MLLHEARRMSPVIISDVLCYVTGFMFASGQLGSVMMEEMQSQAGGNEFHSSQIEEHTMDFISFTQ